MTLAQKLFRLAKNVEGVDSVDFQEHAGINHSWYTVMIWTTENEIMLSETTYSTQYTQASVLNFVKEWVDEQLKQTN